jgi:dephospho-CoA kinase
VVVKIQVLFDHGGNKVIAVVMAGVPVQRQRLAWRPACRFERFRKQLEAWR